MATKAEKEKLMEVLRFTPRTYKIQMWGYGGEKIMGTVDRKIYDYFRRRRLDLSDYCWDSDYADENNIPEDMQPFPSGSWYECDDMAHTSGVARSAGTLQIEDEHGETVYEKRLEDITGGDENEPEWGGGEESWIDEKPAGTVVFIGSSNEKGTFFEGEILLTQPFDISKLTLCYDEIDGEELVNRVEYDGVEIDNWGANSSGKSSDFGFYIAGSQKATGTWEKYTNMDDIEYEMTEWFPKKVKPAREGLYRIKTPGKTPYTYQCKWTGSKWVSSYVEPDDYDTADEVKIKEWQGLAADPDADVVWDPAVELDKIVADFTFEQGVAALEQAVAELGAEIGAHETGTDNPVDFPQTGWPFAGSATTETEESQSKWWTVRTYYKKSCEQHEYFVQNEGSGKIKVVDGFRSCTYNVETNDGEFPKFEFTYVPGGNGDKDSIDMNSINGANIESSELVEMFDGGCWGDNEFEGLTLEEIEKLEEFLSENGAYALEDEGEWYLDDTEVWVWGPLEVEDDEGNVRIICADENGNMIDFVEE
jgi:hypothetical protein